MRFQTKEELEKYIKDFTIPSQLKLDKSPIGGNGLYANINLPKNTEFKVINLGNGYNSITPLRRYTWWGDGTIYGGIGYYCNGSCDRFLELIKSKINKLGPYKLYPYNTQLVNDKFITLLDIPKGTELILDYGDQYFFKDRNFNKLITDGYGNFIDLNKLKLFTDRIKKSFSR